MKNYVEYWTWSDVMMQIIAKKVNGTQKCKTTIGYSAICQTKIFRRCPRNPAEFTKSSVFRYRSFGSLPASLSARYKPNRPHLFVATVRRCPT